MTSQATPDRMAAPEYFAKAVKILQGSDAVPAHEFLKATAFLEKASELDKNNFQYKEVYQHCIGRLRENLKAVDEAREAQGEYSEPTASRGLPPKLQTAKVPVPQNQNPQQPLISSSTTHPSPETVTAGPHLQPGVLARLWEWICSIALVVSQFFSDRLKSKDMSRRNPQYGEVRPDAAGNTPPVPPRSTSESVEEELESWKQEKTRKQREKVKTETRTFSSLQQETAEDEVRRRRQQAQRIEAEMRRQVDKNKPLKLPTESAAAVARLLALDDQDFYAIIGVDPHCTAEEITKNYRAQSRRVHPDKCSSIPDADAAFKRLSRAHEVLGDKESRERYDEMKFQETDEYKQYEKAMHQEMEEILDRIKERKAQIFCSKCQKSHPKIRTDREASRCRWCKTCRIYHSALDGDVWAETEYVFKWHFYANLDDTVYEVTDWAVCQGLADERTGLQANACKVRCSIKSSDSEKIGGRGMKNKASQRNHRPPAPDFEDVEDLISYLREMKEKELEEGESRLRRRGMAPPASSKGKKKAAKKKR